ncbi:GNAT family N-acetyltransferase [Paenibacillus sp. PK3_47]|uniref:GNAT family N-acetyltransferase n=1 Tax=Paenibacillus sp. PK3_47 TaxID=2072642 RepID=UPI00201DD777|nr:GNAT family protein [Paenibacillus sp. PK3_47]UQZ34273.1 GNAT family N-acetyltransferase [Paenibacillus sp. PK3_47]
MSFKLYNHARGIYVSLLQLEDAGDLLHLRLRNRSHHQPFEPLREEDYFTLQSQRQLISQRIEEALEDRAYMFGIFLMDGTLIGQITLSNVVRGVGQYADMGYFIDHEQQGQGYTSAAVGLILKYAFQALALHRVQACILLHNHASRRVLEKNGFQAEGIARRYIKINGEWQDHRTYGVLAEDLMQDHL